MLKSLVCWFGLSSRTLLLLLVLIGGVSLTGCGKIPLLGGGPNVAANTQVGKTNTQTIGTSTVNGDQKLVRPQARTIKQTQDTTRVKTDQVENITVNEIPPWVILLLILGWLLPSPGEMVRGFVGLFRK
jgi:hypothetical protein